MDEAFEVYRIKMFGAYAAYPVDAYTHFCAGWKAASMGRAPTIEQANSMMAAAAQSFASEKFKV